jgi:FkbM family methyltransferase
MATAKIGKFEVQFTDSVEFHSLKREIWGGHLYFIDEEFEAPKILDLGAHIGLASLYFKTVYPDSQIVAYEPLDNSFKHLTENLAWNNIEGVETHNRAVSTGEAELTLYVNEDKAWLSTSSVFEGAWNESQTTTPILFPATPLSEILKDKFDIIKMDLEGYEYELVRSVKDQLTQGKNWLIEVHGKGHYDVRDLVKLFEQAGFTVELTKGGGKIKSHQLSGLALLWAHSSYSPQK